MINRNLLGDESLAPKKVCTELFGTGRLKIIMNRHAACCMRQDHTSNPTEFQTASCRLHTSSLEVKLREHAMKKFF